MRLVNYIWCGAVLLIFIVVGGCATTAGYEQVLNTWVGASEASLVNSSWGIPNGSYQAGGRKYLTYNSSSTYTTPVRTEVRCSTSHTGATHCNTETYGGTTYNYSCKTTFYVESSRVIGYKFKGNDCTAVAPKTKTKVKQSKFRYVGEKKGGLAHGQGSVSFKDGSKVVGEWRNDQIFNGEMYDKHGNVIAIYKNGEYFIVHN